MPFPVDTSADAVLDPVDQGLPLGMIPTGRVFWVDGTVGIDHPNYGTVDLPFDTLKYAITQCVSGRRDTIVIKPTHTETLGAALSLNKSHVTVIGLRSGASFPTFGIGQGAYITMAADNVTLIGLRLNEVSAPGQYLIVMSNASDACHILGCRIYTGGANYPTGSILLSGGNNHIVAGNHIQLLGAATASDYGIGLSSDTNNTTIVGNYIAGDFNSACIYAAGGTHNDVTIAGNYLYNVENDDAAGIIDFETAGTAATGTIADNRGYYALHNDGSALEQIILAYNCALDQNFFSNQFAESGGLVGQGVST